MRFDEEWIVGGKHKGRSMRYEDETEGNVAEAFHVGSSRAPPSLEIRMFFSSRYIERPPATGGSKTCIRK